VDTLSDTEVESFITDAVVLFAENRKVDAYNEFRRWLMNDDEPPTQGLSRSLFKTNSNTFGVVNEAGLGKSSPFSKRNPRETSDPAETR